MLTCRTPIEPPRREKIYVVMELVPNGELFDYVTANGYLDEARARELFHQMIDAVDYCHKLGVYHRRVAKRCRDGRCECL